MSLLNDLRFAVRLLLKERWSSAAAVLALALGIGANATGFTIVNAAILRGLPFDDPRSLFVVSWQTKEGRSADVSSNELARWRAQTRSMSLAAFHEEPINISDDAGAPVQTRGAALTANTFGVLRQTPIIGRDFEARDELPGADPVLLLGFELWTNRYRADPNIIGKSIRANGTLSTIVGVMPRGMGFPETAEMWTPFTATDASPRDRRLLSVIGRLNTGVDVRSARAEMGALATQAVDADADASRDIVGIQLQTFADAFSGAKARTMFITVMCAVVFVLLIACVNVANLLLARSSSRAREMALRLALGATRLQVVRQLLVESLLLSFLGGGLGLALAVYGASLFESSMQVAGKPYWLVFTVDPVVVAYVTAACVLTALLCGLAPALHVSATSNYELLKEGSRGVAGSSRVRWFSGSMVVVELALTMILLAGASLMMHSFLKLYALDLGINADHVLAMQIDLPERKYPTVDSRRTFFAQLSARLQAAPGTQTMAVTTAVPPLDDGERLLEVGGAPSAASRPRFVSTVRISPQFFDVVGRPLVRGRDFAAQDGLPGSENVIVNERLAAQFFPGEDPIGRQLRFTRRQPVPGQQPEAWRTIVGVSAPIRQGSPQDAYLGPVAYIPYRQDAPRSVSLLVKSGLSTPSAANAVRQAVESVDGEQPVATVRTIDEIRAIERWPQRVFGSLFAILAVMAVALSVIGVYGVISHGVSERTQEIGVRIAIGAQPLRVLWLVLRRGLVQLAIGIPLGIAGAVALGTVLQSMLVDMSPIDPLTLGTAVLVLGLVTVVACLIPARRATRIDPMVVLK